MSFLGTSSYRTYNGAVISLIDVGSVIARSLKSLCLRFHYNLKDLPDHTEWLNYATTRCLGQLNSKVGAQGRYWRQQVIFAGLR